MKRTICLAIPLVGLLACGKHEAMDAGYSEATPETAAFQLELVGDSAGEGLSASALGEEDGDVTWRQQALSGNLPEYLQRAREAIKALNATVAAVLTPIAHAIHGAPKAMPGDVYVWVQDHDSATYRFTMKKAAAKTWGWKLEAKPKGGADGAYVVVMGGLFTQGELARRGRGLLGFDLSKLATVEPGLKARGQLLVGFAHVGGHKVLTYALKDFTPDMAQYQPVSALFGGWRGPSGATAVRLAFHGNVADTATAAKELVLLHARWLPGVGGRVDALAGGGDIPAGHAYVTFSCFNRDGEGDAKGYLLIADCQKGALTGPDCKKVREEGMLANCGKGLDQPAAPPADPAAPMPMPGAPETPTAPGTIPDGSGN